jgi:hypothetical protein
MFRFVVFIVLESRTRSYCCGRPVKFHSKKEEDNSLFWNTTLHQEIQTWLTCDDATDHDI